MATRFYLPSFGTAEIGVTSKGNWDKLNAALEHPLSTSSQGSAMSTMSSTSGATNPEFHLFRQFISAPLAAQTILAGFCRGQIRARQNNAAFNGHRAFSCCIINNNGDSVRGWMVGPTPVTADSLATIPPGLYLGSTPANGPFQGPGDVTEIPYSGVTVQSGDRIFLEVGLRDQDAGTRLGYLVFGDNGANWLTPGSGALESVNNPWIEFDHTFDFGLVDPRWTGEFVDMFEKKRKVIGY